ncbi:MAG TPA: LLM class flavin-dependent oxidoreductase [Acidimicrobiia bacterium]|nr:LLM class flavin-dependent oxidoreductase [Acidimicrobiia bacterium]
MDASRPCGPGSVSLRCYPHLELDAPEILAEMRAQAALAAEHGFDGVMTSEHHGGFAGYLPNPLQLAGFLLDGMPRGWAAACPVLATLRPAALIAEETAWLAARYPERVGVGLAAGALAQDFEVMDLDMHDLTARFTRALERVCALLRGETDGVLAGDPAIARCREHPIPVVSAAASATAARRAARVGAGIILDSLTSVARCRELTDAYRGAGGTEAVVLVRRAWIGEPPRDLFERQVSVYRGYASPDASATWRADEMLVDTDGDALAARIEQTVRAAGADACNVRIHVPGIDAARVRTQITRLGQDVVPTLRDALRAA